MPKRTKINKTHQIQKASDFEDYVVDKRQAKRAKSRKNRRNRHYVKAMLRNMTEEQQDL